LPHPVYSVINEVSYANYHFTVITVHILLIWLHFFGRPLGRALGTMCRLSLSVISNACIVAKW